MDTKSFWWAKDTATGEYHGPVMQAVKQLESQQGARSQDNLRHARLYGNFDAAGFGPMDYARSRSSHVNRLSFNVVASATDTLMSKLAKNRPRPSFQTFGGNWKQQQKAKQLDKFCQGKFYETKLYQKGRAALLDACVLGTGALKFFEENGRVCAERVIPDELIVDDAEGIYGAPRQLFQRKDIAREVLLSSCEKGKRAGILSAKPSESMLQNSFADMVRCWEAWHLPSGPDAKDGKHVIVLDSVTLHEEEWTKPYFPFAFLPLFPRLVGFWGQGVAERLTPFQLEINRLLREITETLRLVSKGRMFLERGAKVVKSHLNNEIGAIVEYTGAPPIISNGNAVPPEIFQQLDRIYQRAYEEIGISQLSANARKPAGLDSGKALREYNDIETERFVLIGQAYEQFYMDASRILIDMTRDVYERRKDEGEEACYPVRVPGKKFLETVDWKDIDLEEDEYTMQVFPASSLPTTPAARLASVQELVQGGFIDKTEAMRVMDMPDLEAANRTNLALAALDDVEATIGEILDDGKRAVLEEFQNLELFVKHATAAYLHARHESAPDDRLQLLQDAIQQAAEMLQKAAPPAPPPGPGGPGAPPGALPPGAPMPGGPGPGAPSLPPPGPPQGPLQ